MQPTETIVSPQTLQAVQDTDGAADLSLDGRAPERAFAPDGEQEAVEAVAWARENAAALLPVGGGTALEQGNLLRAPRWAALSTARMTGLVEFSPDDMVVTARAGMTLAALQQELAASSQFLPVDAPEPERATLGGIVATNAQGLLRPAFGAPRDRLLGLRVVMADGSVVRGGGKVVKNVAGYDLCKLFAGSWGTLGLIAEVTFKTNPLPAARRQLVYAAPDPATAARAALEVHAARLQPTWMTVVVESGGAPRLCVGLLGGAEAVEWQTEAITRALAASGLTPADDGPDEDALRHVIVRAPGPVAARISSRPSALPALLDRLAALMALPDVPTDLAAHVPTGIVEMAMGAPVGDDAARRWRAALERAAVGEPALVWTRVPTDWKAAMDVWGPMRGDFALMRGIKRALDPRGIFSPGRFVGGAALL